MTAHTHICVQNTPPTISDLGIELARIHGLILSVDSLLDDILDKPSSDREGLYSVLDSAIRRTAAARENCRALGQEAGQ